MRIWSILLMKSYLKCCIHLDIFLYFNHLTHLEQWWPSGLSSWLAEQEDRGSIPGLATWIFRDWLSPASKSRYGWKIAKSTLILKTTNQPNLTHLGRVTAGRPESPLMAHAAMFYVRLKLIRSVSRALTFSVLKCIEIVISGVYLPFLLASVCFGTFVISLLYFFSYFVWLRITGDGSVLEMRIWSHIIKFLFIL